MRLSSTDSQAVNARTGTTASAIFLRRARGFILFEERGKDFAEFVGRFLDFVADEGAEHRGNVDFDGGSEAGGLGAIFLEVDAEREGYGAAFGCETYAVCGDALADFEYELSDSGSIHLDAVALKLNAVELFALLGRELLDEVAVLVEVGYFLVDQSDGAGKCDGFAFVCCHIYSFLFGC